ncbi:uncharacterized protein UMAG_05046 [Mycosarcoma maydis]|uniref:RlpA-like protein double-psi beta-barrel domain-containing protein n=1 Tax=Mycosarcoma maydis TaxID=5270 RepID=A0A0D1DXD2_MYCMD|nr:uncharacterized protein UMAG_05046 [Ustilago maydis 521]KIS67180.1 hypothetical protein UMAG_05046 [Ustilago maydis 521]|eukprot:XP_011391334.1 hypothetical protein UMAG_05046 [Ustilago maydis 521]
MTVSLRLSMLLLVVAVALASLLPTASGMSLPAGEHIGIPAHVAPAGEHVGTPIHVAPAEHHLATPAHDSPAKQDVGKPEYVAPTGKHIGTPAHVAPAKQHVGTPAHPNAAIHLPDSIASLSHPRIPEPKSNLQARGRHHAKARQQVPNGKVTFYSGSQLLNPACPGAPTPSDSSMIAAISFDSPFHCGDRVMISGKGKQAVVTIVDRCAACTNNWMDVTKGVFQVFSGLETGVLHDVSFTKM